MPAQEMSPHSENDNNLTPRVNRRDSGAPRQEATVEAIGCSGMPPSGVSSAELERCKLVLEKEQSGISYRSVVEALAKTSWAFSDCIDLESPRVTEKLVQLNPGLAAEFEAKTSREGLLQRFIAAIPFSGRTLPSEKFLRENVGINQIIRDLQRGGLLHITESPPVATASFDPMMRGSPACISLPSWDIKISDRGRLALASS